MTPEVRDTIIIGSGPAGLTAAIYTARAQLKPLMFAGIEFGGQLMNTTLVENFPGFPDGIMGPKLMSDMITQAKNQGTEIINKYVKRVDFSGEIKKVWTDDNEYHARSIVLAVGSSPRRLGVPGENELYGKGVSTCATCDGAFYKEKAVAIVGGGDTAMEEANFLTRFADKVYILHRRDQFRASKAMQERTFANEKIEVVWNTEVKEIIGEAGKVNKLKLYNNVENSFSDLEVDGLFLAIGHVPNTNFLEGQIKMDDAGYVIVEDMTKTSVEGVFVAGEISDYRYKQAITSAGAGCMAGMDAEKYLAEIGE